MDLEEVQAATGIRARYLRAIEEEDWDALPEEFYARSFIRKYAKFLGVDPEPLVEDYRSQRGATGRGDAPTSPFARTNSRRADALRRRRKRQAVYTWVGAGAVIVAIIAAVVLLASGGEEESGGGKSAGQAGAGAGKGATGNGQTGTGKKAGTGTGTRGPRTIALSIEPTAEVWACVRGGNGKPLVDGQVLAAGETMGPFHSRSYTAAFGNGSIEITVNGKHAATPTTPSPIGFTVDRRGNVHELAKGKRPSCE